VLGKGTLERSKRGAVVFRRLRGAAVWVAPCFARRSPPERLPQEFAGVGYDVNDSEKLKPRIWIVSGGECQ
jgi:hypothetical protein